MVNNCVEGNFRGLYVNNFPTFHTRFLDALLL